MPRPKTTVPKFGDWDGGEDLSYSIVFDKARADKESFVPGPKNDRKDPSLEHQRVNAPGFFSEKGASNAVYNRTVETGNRDSRESTPKLSSRDNYEAPVEFKPSQTAEGDQSETSEKGYGDSPSTVPSSQQPMPMVSAKNSTAQEVMLRANGSNFHMCNDGLPGKAHRQMHNNYPVASKFRRSQGCSETSSIADLPEKGNLPKFGDWDVNDANAGEGFTVLFDRARDEKKSKSARKMQPRFLSSLRPAGDLYNDSQPRKKKRGWFSILCCSANTSE